VLATFASWQHRRYPGHSRHPRARRGIRARTKFAGQIAFSIIAASDGLRGWRLSERNGVFVRCSEIHRAAAVLWIVIAVIIITHEQRG